MGKEGEMNIPREGRGSPGTLPVFSRKHFLDEIVQLCDVRQGLTSLCLRKNMDLLCRAVARIKWFGPSIPKNQLLLLLEASWR